MTDHRPQINDEQEPPYPDLDEVQQHESQLLSVPVSVDGPIQVQQLPAIDWASHHYSLSQTDPVTEILPANDRRKSAIISVRGQIIYISRTKPGCTPNDGVPLAAPSQTPVTHTKPVYAIGGNVAASEIGVIEEFLVR